MVSVMNSEQELRARRQAIVAADKLEEAIMAQEYETALATLDNCQKHIENAIDAQA